MKGLRKIALIIILTVATIICASAFSTSYAATGSRYLTIKSLRASGYGYQALEKSIWKICESNSTGTTVNYDHTIYCLKGGPGFGSTAFGSGDPTVRHYTRYFDMKDISSITGAYANALPSTSSNTYKALLWLLENVYVPPKANATLEEAQAAGEYRELLLERAGIEGYVTDDDIDAVQQLAVWHFTNDDEYKVENSGSGTFEFWINNAMAGSGNSTYNPLSDYSEGNDKNLPNLYGWERAEECQALYDYLVTTAEQMASTYQITTASQAYALADTAITQTINGNNYIIGPFRINKLNDTATTLTGTFKNGNTVITPTMQDAIGNPFNTIQDTVGKEFYIVLPASTIIENISFTISGSYFDTKLTYWSVEGAPSDDQPVVEVERTKKTYTDTVTFTPKFDLALRKFITSINGVAPAVSREPQISTQTLQNLANGSINTTVKNHPKNALTVKPGDKVIYTIRVYNEGEIDGYVTEVTDYLPEGLKLVENSTINTNNGWTNPSGDGKTIVTTKLAGTRLDAFNKATLNLKYLDVQVECEVVATIQSTDNVLKNIAEITGDSGGIDRDSTPNNVNTNNYGTTSQEDDDDFEQLVILGQYFDLALRKYITSINGDAPAVSRVPQISTQTLQSLANESITTAVKTHPKNALEVENGDKVVYTIRVYNEGEIDGYVTEITDYLPDGLKLAENSTINTNNGWTNPSGDGKTIVTTKLAGTKLDAFNKSTLELKYAEVQIECEVTDTAPQEGKTTLKNIAEITGDSGGTDRDSTPNNVNRNNYGTTSQEDDDDFEDLVLIGKKFDLALRKFITSIDGNAPTVTREPQIDNETLQDLANDRITTAIKTHPKNALEVQTGSKVIYTIRVYNEGEVDGYVTEITDYLPDGLKLAENSTINTNNGWTNPSGDGKTIVTDKLAGTKIEAFDKGTLELKYLDVQVECEVVATKGATSTSLKNVAEITKAEDDSGNENVADRDSDVNSLTESQKNNYNPGTSTQGYGYQDDDDYEELTLPAATGDFEIKIVKKNGIDQKLQGAIFKVEELNEAGTVINTYNNLTTNELGEVLTGRIQITGVGTRIYRITEVQAPEGYAILKEEIRIEVNIAIQNGVYTVSIGETSGKIENTQVVGNNTIQITIENNNFDLALRKFITGKNNENITNRVPVFSIEDGKYVYTHTKDPIDVLTGDTVIYTLRIYNEGTEAGYAEEVKDDIPDGLEFLPNNSINTDYRWVMYDANGNVTQNVSEAVSVRTDYLSKAQGEATGRDNLIEAFNPETMSEPDYKEVRIAFKVVEPNTSDRILINTAEISEDSNEDGEPVDDVDSTPDNNEEDEDDIDIEKVKLVYFDLTLRKFITSINGVAPTVSREPQISNQTLQDLADGKITTTVKTHPKNALTVKTGDKVVYTIRVYNEGEVDGYVTEITDYLPEGLKLAENSTINTENGWTNPSGDGKTIVTDKLAGTKIEAFDKDTLELKYLDVQVECEVVATIQTTDNVLKNIAEITEDNGGTDIDSTPGNVDKDNYGTTNQEDDDDFEQLVILGQYFDLSLRKFITAVGDEELVDENGKYIREPEVDVTPLLDGENTAIYKHNKQPVNVDVDDIVTYTIRIYNEGEIDGYVHEIVDHLPEYLEFVNDEFNASYGWKVSSDGRTVTTDITSPNTEYSASRDTLYADRTEGNDKVVLKAFDEDTETLDYIDVKIRCKVKDTGIAEKITNIAEITEQTDTNGNELTDRDSIPENVTLPADEVLPDYKDEEIERGDEYIPGQEDDDDFEKVIVQKFDLALRKFITGVNNEEIAGRVPTFSVDSEGNMVYTHPKTPVEVVNGDIVIYTIRVYNEGNQSGYADEVKDDIPEGLVYLPDNELNQTYRWKMYREDGTETTDVSEAKTIRTDYLSKAQEDETGRENLIDAFDRTTMTQPDYKDVKVAFRVTEPNTSDRVLINTAEITEDSDEKGEPVEDIDSTPDNNDDEEDDIDIEKVKVKYFDLALEKIISEYSITLNGKTTTTETGHEFGVQPEPVVKVETLKNTRKNATIKFKYQIKVTNEGEIAGYATEIKDYIPTGLEFVQEDNPEWILSDDGQTVTTDQLKDTLLEPGESAVIEITFKWINGEDNLGLKQNWAEISKDKNDSDSPDIDSTPDNNEKGEDDIDDASVILSVVTGVGENYALIGTAVLAIITGGVVLIKKFVI